MPRAVSATSEFPRIFHLGVVESIFRMGVVTTLSKKLSAIESLPTGLRKLKHYAEDLEKTRLSALRALDSFRMLTSVSATRARMLMDYGIKTFRTNLLERALDHKLRDLEFLLSSQYNLRLQKQLQLLAIIVGFFTLVVAIAGIVGMDQLITFFRNLVLKLSSL